MAPNSMSRYRLAILAVTALAAGCSIYYIRENFWHESSSSQGLRRRNAVHRPRRQRTRQESGEASATQPSTREVRATIIAMLLSFDTRGPNHHYGYWQRDIGGTLVSCPLRRNALASSAYLQEAFHLDPSQAATASQEIENAFLAEALQQILESDVAELSLSLGTGAQTEMPYLRSELASRGFGSDAIQAATEAIMSRASVLHQNEMSESGPWRRQSPLRDASGLRQHPPGEPNGFGRRGEGEQPTSEPVRRGPRTPPDLLDFSETVAEEEAEGLSAGIASNDESKREGQSLLNLLYYIAEDQSRKDGYVHRQVTCNQCSACPIRGIRYRCSNCVDFDLCEQCESTQQHTPTHIFYKVRVPAPFPFVGNPRQPQPTWYPGKPHDLPPSLPRDMVQRFSQSSKFEDSEIAALWDQFRCLASQPWESDPNQLGMAVDHDTVERCFMPSTSLRSPPPNLIHNLMFSFYDTDGNGLIGFEEFVMGLACLREKGGKANHKKRLRIFAGYDLDRDGYVCRKDFLRMFRSYYALMKELNRELIAGMEEDASDYGSGQSARDIATGSQPLSSAFSGSIPPGRPSRTGEAKILDRFGDLILPQGLEITRENYDGEGDHHETIGDTIEHNRFDNIARPMAFERFHSMLGHDSPDDYAIIYNLGNRLLQNPNVDSDNESVEYTHNDDRDISGGTDNRNRGEDAQGEGTGTQRQRTDSLPWPLEWIHPSDAEQALGYTAQLRDVTDHADRCKVMRAALKRINREDIESRQVIRNEGVSARWQRRHFYLDEEDGATQPEAYNKELWESADTEDPDETMSGQATMNGHPRLSRRSRSSSKVRFVEDDVIDEPYATRSRSSTSVSSRSIPVGERWGGLEVPEPEKDVGREVLYQVTHEAMNEMLDPIFKHREDLAMEILQTRAHRATSRLQEYYDRVPQLEKLVSAEMHELLRQWRIIPEYRPFERQTNASNFLLFLKDVIKAERRALTPANHFLRKFCQQFGIDQAQACFLTALSETTPQTSTSSGDHEPQDNARKGDGSEANSGVGDELRQKNTNEEKQPAKLAFPVYKDDPDIAYPEAALELQDAVSAFNEIDSAPQEATISTKPLSELLAESGYAIATPELPNSGANTLEPEQSTSLPDENTNTDPTMPQNRPNASPTSATVNIASSNLSPDPTLPQNRPNSIPSSSSPESFQTQQKLGSSDASPESFQKQQKPSPSFLFSAIEPHRQILHERSIEPQTLKYYAFLDCIEKEDRQRGGPGRMNFEEFEEIMNSERGKGLGFVESWIDLASF